MFSSCKEAPSELTPVAKFTTPNIEFGEVTFRNYSRNATEYFWEFGDGNTSTEKDPVYEYLEFGNYTVTLTASDGTNADDYELLVPISKIYPPNLFEIDNFSEGGKTETLFFTWDGKGYVGFGITDFQTSFSLWEFDPMTESWTQKSNAPRGFTRGVSFVIDGIAYIGLGQSNFGPGAFDFYAYDIANDTYTLETEMPFQNLNNNQFNSDAVSFAYDGKGYVIGGNTNGSLDQNGKVWEYDPVPKTWTQKQKYPGNGDSGMYCFVIGDKAYVGLGNEQYYTAYFNEVDFWEYDIPNDTWTRKNDFPGSDRRDGISFTYNGKGYIGFGWRLDATTGSFRVFSDLWEYEPFNDEWTKIEDMPLNAARHLHGFVIDDSFYFGRRK